MPKLDIVGRVDPESLDLDPVVIPVAAYRIDTREEVVEEFAFKPTMPTGVLALIERLGGRLTIDPTGGPEGALNPVLVALSDCLMPEDRERWTEFLESDDLHIQAETIGEVFKALMEHYGRRPTRRSSGSSRTGKRGGQTSKAPAASEG